MSFRSRTRPPAPIAALAIVSLLCLLSPTGRAAACSCVWDFGSGEFLDPAPQELPANAAGLVWRGFIPDPDGDGKVALGFLTVEEIGPSGAIELEADIKLLVGDPRRGHDGPGSEWLRNEPILVSPDFPGDSVELAGQTIQVRGLYDPARPSLEGLLVVAPRAGLKPGTTYRFGFDADPTPGSVDYRTLEVRVSEEELAPGRGTVLRQDEPVHAPIKIAMDASCSARVEAVRARLALDLSESAQRFANTIHFTTLVNGQVWRPRVSICDRLPIGESWRGRGQDEVYLGCADPPAEKLRGVGSGLFAGEQGGYDVEIVAWLPGRFEVARGRAVLELGCDHPS